MIENTFIVNMELDGLRLDKAIHTRVPHISRSRIQSLIKDEKVAINGVSGKWVSSKVRTGMKISITIPDTQDLPMVPENIPLDILFEDAHIILVNKPAGMVVHPAPGNETGTLVNAVLYHAKESLSGIGGIKRPGIVHRIDKDTSGVLVIAKSDMAHHGLSDMFKSHTIERTYCAYVWGHVHPTDGTITGNIGRHKTDRKRNCVLPDTDVTGKHAVTHYKTIKRYGILASKITCHLETGRTHQIRVHMSHRGHGLIGDPVYGRPPKGLQRTHPALYDFLQEFHRQSLHATSLGFIHPITKQKVWVEKDIPTDLQDLEKLLEVY